MRCRSKAWPQLCGYSVEHRRGKLKGVEAVEAVEVDYKSGKAVVRTAEGVILFEAKAQEVVSGAGFKLSGYEALRPDAASSATGAED